MTQAVVTIEPLSPDFYGQAASWIAKPDVQRWLYAEWRERPVVETVVAVVAMSAKNRLFLIRDAGAPVGLVTVSQIHPHDRHGTIWYLLGEPGLGGRGVATTAVRLLAEHAFRAAGLHSLEASVHEPNVRSRRVLEKNGFRLVGRMRQAFGLDDGLVDRLVFERISTDTGGI